MIHPSQLSLAIRPWVGAMSTSEKWDMNGHIARCTSHVSEVLQCKPVSGCLTKETEINATTWAIGPYGLGRTLLYVLSQTHFSRASSNSFHGYVTDLPTDCSRFTYFATFSYRCFFPF